MLVQADTILGCRIKATDSEFGDVADLLMDDHDWVVRYLVIDTGHWLPGRRVLISPVEVLHPDWDEEILPVDMSAEQIENSPPLETELPISRRKEVELSQYFGWVPYWEPFGGIGFGPEVADMAVTAAPTEEEKKSGAVKPKPGLRSVKEIEGYRIHAEDGDIGHVDDFLVDPEKWAMRYFIVDTRNFLPGRKVLIPPDWIDRIEWESARVFTEVSREGIRTSPEFDPNRLDDPDFEAELRRHYRQDEG
jgi:hypothetical protein